MVLGFMHEECANSGTQVSDGSVHINSCMTRFIKDWEGHKVSILSKFLNPILNITAYAMRKVYLMEFVSSC